MECPYLHAEDITPWHGDVFDHPNFRYTCLKDPEHPKELILQDRQCARCKLRQEQRKGGKSL